MTTRPEHLHSNQRNMWLGATCLRNILVNFRKLCERRDFILRSSLLNPLRESIIKRWNVVHKCNIVKRGKYGLHGLYTLEKCRSSVWKMLLPLGTTDPLRGHGEKKIENFSRAHLITSRAHVITITCSRNNFTCSCNNFTCARNNITCARNNYYVLT